MLVLVIVLIVTNLVTLGVLARYVLRPVEQPAPDAALAASVSARRAPVSSTGTRRVITIEILNPIELAGTRGRLVGIASSLAPGITHRIVYDQALKSVRRQLADERVVADVRLHIMRPEDAPQRAAPTAWPTDPVPPAQAPLVQAPEPRPVDLIKRGGDQLP
jgi:hypothetical protein